MTGGAGGAPAVEVLIFELLLLTGLPGNIDYLAAHLADTVGTIAGFRKVFAPAPAPFESKDE